jgi:DNA-binding NarL/FixJ family response regulator
VKWYRYFIHPFSIGALLSLAVIFIVAHMLPSQKLRICDQTRMKQKGEIYFCDIDQDGTTERIDYFSYRGLFNPTLSLYDSDSSLIALWNIEDSPTQNSHLFFGDSNQDGFREIFVFTQHKDSLFLSVINPQRKKHIEVERRFIQALPDEGVNYQIFPIGLSGQEFPVRQTFYFALSMDHPSAADHVFAYEITGDHLLRSAALTNKIKRPVRIDDLNNDGYPEILVSAQTKENLLTRPVARLMVYNHQLTPLFPPPELAGEPSSLSVEVIETEDQKYIIVLNSLNEQAKDRHTLFLFNVDGSLVAEKKMDWNTGLIALENQPPSRYFTLFSGKHLLQVNADLEIADSKRLTRKDSLRFLAAREVDNNSTPGYFFAGENALYLFSPGYRRIDKLEIPIHNEMNISVQRKENIPDKILVQRGAHSYLLEVIQQTTFLNRYLVFFALFIAITFLVFMITKYIHHRRFTKKSAKIDHGYDPEQSTPDYRLNKENIEAVYEPPDQFQKIELNYPSDLKKRVEQIRERSAPDLDIFFYPYDHWEDVDPFITQKVSQWLDRIITWFAEYEQNQRMNLSIFRHRDYLNILFKLPDLEEKDLFIPKDHEIHVLLQAMNGEADFDFFGGLGALVNVYIPLEIKKSTEKIKIIIAEDHDVSLFGLVTLFKNKPDIDIVGTAKNGMEVLQILDSKQVDIVITDISMPGMDGIELAEELDKHYPEIRVIVFTMYLENWFVEQLIKHGARGFVAKNSKITELVDAVYAVYEGKNYYCPQFKSKYGFNSAAKKEISPDDQLDSLNNYEKKILGFFADNLTRLTISQKLNINTKTLETFIANMMLKLNAGDEKEMILIAKKQKYISG